MVDPRFVEALRLFNERKFFESHEELEKLWLEAKEDANRDLYKGVIQAAAALYQLERERWRGALGLFGSSVRYLQPYEPRACGLDVRSLIRDMKKCFGCFEGWDGEKGPFVDGKLIPRASFSEPVRPGK